MDTMMDAANVDLTTEDSHLSASPYHDRKALVDRCLAAVLLVISAPVIVALMALVRFTSPGAAIYRQVRVGKKGRLFNLLKIRTMYHDAEAVNGPQWAIQGDPRISPVGRVLRFLHLDELPQLINVVRGEMSLVGPRPERPEFVEKLVLDIPDYCDRLAVLPGITGLAQVNLPADDCLASVRRKVIVDRHYVETGSALLDVRILLCTALRMMAIRHGRAPRWLGLEYKFAPQPANIECTADSELGFEDAVMASDSLLSELAVNGIGPGSSSLASPAYAMAIAPAAKNGAPVRRKSLISRSRRPR